MGIFAISLTGCGAEEDTIDAIQQLDIQEPGTAKTEVSLLGQRLVGGADSDKPGFTLYVYDDDIGSSGSACYTGCMEIWPPLLVTDTEASGISNLSTIVRNDGFSQATYNGRPLYFSMFDDATSDTEGQGANGGKWSVAESSGGGDTGDGGDTGGNVDPGRGVYFSYCVGCHGADGRGGSMPVSVVTSIPLTEFTAYIENSMPKNAPFACRGECAENVANYIRATFSNSPPVIPPSPVIDDGIGGDADAGRALYDASCAGCHGADGRGGSIPVSVTSDLPYLMLVDIIDMTMPPGGNCSGACAEDTARYIRNTFVPQLVARGTVEVDVVPIEGINDTVLQIDPPNSPLIEGNSATPIALSSDEGGDTDYYSNGSQNVLDAELGPADIIGILQVRVLDSRTDRRVSYSIKTTEGQRVLLLFQTDAGLPAGQTVHLWGDWVNEHRFSVSSWKSVPTTQRIDAALVRQPTHHSAAILSMQEVAVSEREALLTFNGKSNSLQHFMNETTRGIDTFSADIFRRYDIDYSAKDCQFDNTYKLVDRLIAQFENNGFDISDYDHILTVVPKNCGSDWTGAWADIGSIGDIGTLNFARISMYKDNVFDPWYLAHQLGHNLALHHAQAIDCGSSFYNADAAGCEIEEYGNFNDVMGWGEGVYWGTPNQRFMGWVSPTQVVTAAGTATFNLHPADGNTCGIRALRIPIPSEPGFYFYVEYRHARQDSLYAGTGGIGDNRGDSVLITRSRDGAGSSSNNQRLEIGVSRNEGAQIAQRYDLGSGVSIEVIFIGGDYASVFVEMPGDSNHLRDDGTAATVDSDGSIGPILRDCS